MNWLLMEASELHAFGISVILPYLEKEGVLIEKVNASPDMSPQIIGSRWGSAAHIYVKTALYPNKGELSETSFANALEWSNKQGATAFFASVGLACTNYPDKSPVEDESHAGLPIRNAGFAVSYQGLIIMTTSDKVRILKEGN